MFQYFEEPATAPINIVVDNKNLENYAYCGSGFCHWKPAK